MANVFRFEQYFLNESKNKECDDKCELTPAQKKLPEGLRKAIEAKNKKK